MYIVGRGPAAPAGGAVSAGEPLTALQAAANSRAAAAWSTRSSRLRQRGHQEGWPVKRAPQLGHSSIRNVSASRAAKLSLKDGRDRTDVPPVSIVVGLLISLLISYLGYREAAKHQAEYGKPPWNISPMLWAVIVFATGLLVGGILLWVARRSDRKRDAAPQLRVSSGSGRPGSVL